MSYISDTSHSYAFTGGCRHTSEPNIFWVWVARDPFNAGISLRISVSTKKRLGTRAGTFAPGAYNYNPILLIYIDLLKKDGGCSVRSLGTLHRLDGLDAQLHLTQTGSQASGSLHDLVWAQAHKTLVIAAQNTLGVDDAKLKIDTNQGARR